MDVPNGKCDGFNTSLPLTLKGQCKPHGLGIILGESCSKLLLHCTKWGFF